MADNRPKMNTDYLLGAPDIESFSGTHRYRPECVVTATELDWFGEFDEDKLRRLSIGHANRVTDALAAGKCPRCSDVLDPTNTAGSRVTQCRCIPVCPACGSDEGNQRILGKPYSAVWEWPIGKGWRTRRAAKVADMAGPAKTGILDPATGSLITEDGALTLDLTPTTGGWAQYGHDDDHDDEGR